MPQREDTALFDRYESPFRESLLELRQLIFDTAERLAPNDPVEESLKWNQPSYKIKTASPIRIDRFGEDHIALFFQCQTTLVETFRELFPDNLEFSKNRAIVLDPKEALPKTELVFCIEMALTYHQTK